MSLHWHSLHDFLAMGGYGLYVWPSFGLAALLMTVEPLLLARRRRRLLARLRHLAALQDKEAS